jgi:hypothetical protein
MQAFQVSMMPVMHVSTVLLTLVMHHQNLGQFARAFKGKESSNCNKTLWQSMGEIDYLRE